jgi:osmotically-inducible protein OsmY
MVQLSTNSDAQIQRNVLRQLRLDRGAEETDIGVVVGDGVVTLTGMVGTFAAKQAAAEAAHRVVGVLDVANELLVKAPGAGSISDAELAQSVRRMLEWDTLIPGEHIQGTVRNGWVTLIGTVDHRTYRDAAERAVRYLRGVSGVTNQLTISAPPVDPAEVRTAIARTLQRHSGRDVPHIGVEVTAGTIRLTGRVHSWSENRAVVGAAGHALGVHAVCDDLIIDPNA